MSGQQPDHQAMREVLGAMPHFPGRASALERSLETQEEEITQAAGDGAWRRQESMLERDSAPAPPIIDLLPAPQATDPLAQGLPLLDLLPGLEDQATTNQPDITTLHDLLSGSTVSLSVRGNMGGEERAATGEAASSSLQPSVVAAPTPAPSASFNVMDMLEGLAPTLPAPALANDPKDPFAQASGEVELVPTSQTSGVVSRTVHPSGDPDDWFQKLCVSDSGVLYEDPHIQIGLKAMYKGSVGRVVLYFGNKHGSNIEELRINIVPIPGLRITVVNSLPAALFPKQQFQYIVDVACTGPFLKVPQVQLGYFLPVESLRVYPSMRLPTPLTKFLQPLPVANRDEFFEKWRALGGPPLKLQEVVHVKPSLTGGLTALAALFNALKLNVVPGLDPNQDNLVTAAVLAQEAPEEVMCIVRLEKDANDASRFRVTVATSSQIASSSVKEVVVCHLKS